MKTMNHVFGGWRRLIPDLWGCLGAPLGCISWDSYPFSLCPKQVLLPGGNDRKAIYSDLSQRPLFLEGWAARPDSGLTGKTRVSQQSLQDFLVRSILIVFDLQPQLWELLERLLGLKPCLSNVPPAPLFFFQCLGHRPNLFTYMPASPSAPLSLRPFTKTTMNSF